MEHHLQIWRLHHLFYSLLGNPEHLVLLVVHADAGHLLKVADVASSDGFQLVYPQLSEVDGTSVEVGHVGHQQLTLPLPARDAHSTADDGMLALDGQSAVLRTQAQRFVEVVRALAEVDGHFCGLS